MSAPCTKANDAGYARALLNSARNLGNENEEGIILPKVRSMVSFQCYVYVARSLCFDSLDNDYG